MNKKLISLLLCLAIVTPALAKKIPSTPPPLLSAKGVDQTCVC